MSRLLQGFLLGLLCASPALARPPLAGVEWRSLGDLQELAGVTTLRHVAPGIALVDAAPADLAALGARVLFTDRARPGEAYYLSDHVHARPAGPPVTTVYRDPGGWALHRLPSQRLTAALDVEHFLYPLPESYATPSRARAPRPAPRPAQRPPSEEVRQLLGQVDVERMRADLDRLVFLDPPAGAVAGNVRTRHARRPETFASTTFLQRELAAALGEEAVRLDTFRIEPGDTLMYNVVGELRGTDPEAGYWVVCAHYDAIGSLTRLSDMARIGEGRVAWDWRLHPAPGADDNGTGVVLLLETARILSQRSFPFSIRFIAFSGEELGLWGSDSYARRAGARQDRVLGVLNFDMVGFNDLAERVELVTNPSSAWIVDLMAAAAQRYDLGLQVDILEDRYAGLSDHAPFWAQGYDAILAIENYLPTDSTSAGVMAGDYRINTHYHTVADLPDSINWELVTGLTRLTLATLAQFGAEEGLPNLAVFGGDLAGDGAGGLLARISNLGPVPAEGPVGLRLQRCRSDSTGCEVVFEGAHPGPVPPGAAVEVRVPWPRYGEALFLVEVDPGDRIAEEVETADNRAFVHVRLVPDEEIVVFPNPLHRSRDGFSRFFVPAFSRLDIYDPHGVLVWQGREESGSVDQRGEIRWTGVNAAGNLLGSGVYFYEVRSFEGDSIERGKIALLR